MMAKRNLQRERERRKALARQQRMIAKAKRRRRNQIIAGVTVAAVAVGGLAAVIITSALSGRNDEPAAAPSDTGAVYTPEPDPTEPGNGKATYTAVPDPSLAEGREWTGTMQTSVGEIAFTLDGAAAPQATANFVQLARDGYYDASSCHRLTTDGIFVLQCGSLTGDGTDSPGYQFGPLENVPEDDVYPPGTIAMARAGTEDSQGAQFFITYQESVIQGGYSVFGHVTSGLEAIEGVAASGTEDGGTDGRPAIAVTIDGIELQ
ncbi:MAG: peptidylprolyl isomerase [Bifidobacteriaceae bacterium]|jgi:peptidyl-prolyl cis-trans isomerase B (cyclophilin B)|nr:peptidylprolyl isomerase [Bifidobacteriaceae bacterium]